MEFEFHLLKKQPIMIDKNIIIGLAGDLMIGRGVNNSITNKGYLHPWGNILSLLKNTDFNLINLEAALTNSNKKVDKTFNFKASPDKIKILTEAEITVVNIANNHILDFSEDGLIETIETLKKAGIKYVGAGMNNKEATKPVILRVKDKIFGILGLTDNEPEWEAGTSSCGVSYIDISKENDRNQVLMATEKLRQKADIVIVSIHWGPNMNVEPEQNFIDFAHALIDHGADIIHGHSAHNFQGIEVYKQKLILYDTGDFIDDYAVDPYFKNDHSFFFKIKITESKIEKLILVPVLISNKQVNIATTEDRDWSLKRMQKLSAKFGTKINDNGEVFLF
jgi:poly-gamma-glutamate capsule biosynthesis protein CapA/YwtB (metallophosphatase superfamily)